MTLSPEFLRLQRALLGRYSLERELGRGGMGTVYLARDIRLERAVAIKVLHPQLAARAESREHFLHEARTAARLAHPHIIPIFSVETIDDQVLMVMAVVDGETLGERIRRRGALPPDDAERLLREMAWALGYAHAHGVIHRDLTLENVLLERHSGRALLVDFGLAAEEHRVDEGPRFGTPGFLAPEVIRGDAATAASDLYALGVVGWTALAGRPPFTAESPAQLLAKHLVQPPPPLTPLARGASRRLTGVIEACLAKQPEDRPRDTTDLLARLERAPEPVTVAPALRQWFTRWERIRPVYALATPILALQTKLLVWGAVEFRSSGLLVAALVSSILTITLIPVLVHLGFEVQALRLLHRAGFGVEDIRAAYPHWRERLEHERRKETLPPLPGRVILDLTVVGAIVVFFAFAVILPNLEHFYESAGEITYVRETIYTMLSTVYLATLTGVGIGFVTPGFRVAPGGRFRRLVERFWNSSLAAGITRLASLGQSKRIAATSTLHRNTELVLGLAIGDLWAAIPAELRQDLGDLPGVAGTLQQGAGELRRMIDALHASEEAVGPAEASALALRTTRERLEARHRETVTSLEKLRLHLLRLVASRVSSLELTQQLDAARALEADLLRDIAGQDEVRALIGQSAIRRAPVATPTPSPA